MAVDPHPVYFLDVVGEEIRDILVGRPVDRHAELVAVFGFELGLDVRIGEPVVSEPVQVRELLVRQLVELLVGPCREGLPDEVVDVQHRIGDVLSLSRHPVGQVYSLVVARVRADEVGVVDPTIVDVLCRLHLRLDFFNDVALLNNVVLDFYPGNLLERFREHLGLIFVDCQSFGDHIDLHTLVRFRRFSEPLQFLRLIVLRQSRRLKLRINPFLDRSAVG